MWQIKSFTFNGFLENTYVLHEPGGRGIIIDPGCQTVSERNRLLEYLRRESIRVEGIYNTHCHIDHILGVDFLKRELGLRLWAHSFEQFNTDNAHIFAQYVGMPQFNPCDIDEFLDDKEVLTFGESRLEVLFVPGHSPGHVVFYSAEQGFCIGGDVLFRGSVGRTDLPGGDWQTLEMNIKSVMYTLPPETVVYPGHGEPTTIGAESQSNPFVRL